MRSSLARFPHSAIISFPTNTGTSSTILVAETLLTYVDYGTDGVIVHQLARQGRVSEAATMATLVFLPGVTNAVLVKFVMEQKTLDAVLSLTLLKPLVDCYRILGKKAKRGIYNHVIAFSYEGLET